MVRYALKKISINGALPGRVSEELASLARRGYVAARASFRGSQLSEGTWTGYRSLGWGERRDGYDLCEWFRHR